jgi:hypothetical protein
MWPGIETVKHFLLECDSYETRPEEPHEQVGQRNMKERLIGDLRFVEKLLESAVAMERLKF